MTISSQSYPPLKTTEEQIASFEAVGETKLRYMLHEPFPDLVFDVQIAQEWLKQKEQGRADEALLRRDSREERTLKLARNANIWAAIAALIATIAIYIAASQ